MGKAKLNMSLRESIDEFVGIFLEKADFKSNKDKYVHDPIWGGIELFPWEQGIIDTPLFQRLRQIHQTGCVFATYPSATHSRFEHTLGVMHLAGRMACQLEKHFGSLVDKSTYQKVRLAALGHDLGHSAFSHATEEIYSQCGDIAELTGTGGDFEGKGAGEVLSFLILTSKPFREFFGNLKKYHPDLLIEVDDFAPLVLGRATDPDKNKFFEAQIISSPFDADKLDYFPRDGRSAGLELSLDTDRLLNCLEIHSLSGPLGSKNTMVVHRGGFNPIQQLLFARATLFSTVYHHHKVRACDCMIKAAFERMHDIGKGFSGGQALKRKLDHTSAADFLYLTDFSFFAEASIHDLDSIEHDLLHDLLYRRLLKRTVTVSANTLEGFHTNPDEIRAAYSQFYNKRSNPIEVRELAIRIHDEAGVECTKYRVWLDLPSTPSFEQAGRALMRISQRGEDIEVKPLADFIPVAEWVQTYRQYYAQSFLFGPPDIEQRIKLAVVTRRILREEFGLNLKPNSMPDDIRTAVLDLEK